MTLTRANGTLPRMAGWMLALVLAGLAGATEIHPRAGTTAFPFLDIGYNARAIAMGDAAVGMPDDLYGTVGNPGALGFIQQRQVVFGFRPWGEGVSGAPLGAAMPVLSRSGKEYGVVALSGTYLSSGAIEELDENANLTGTVYRPFSLAGGVSWGSIVWEELSVGVNLKGICDVLGGSDAHAEAVALDAGAQYRLLKSRLIWGIMLRDLGFMVAGYGGDSDHVPLPLRATMGLSYQFRNLPNLRIAADICKPYDNYLFVNGGLEINIYEDIFCIRAGYSASRTDIQQLLLMLGGNGDDTYDKTEWSALRLGVGLNTPIAATHLRFDAAYQMRVDGIAPAFALSSLIGF